METNPDPLRHPEYLTSYIMMGLQPEFRFDKTIEEAEERARKLMHGGYSVEIYQRYKEPEQEAVYIEEPVAEPKQAGALVVDCCEQCPFCKRKIERKLLSDSFFCDAGLKLRLVGDVKEAVDKPPHWCALRNSDRLVTLQGDV